MADAPTRLGNAVVPVEVHGVMWVSSVQLAHQLLVVPGESERDQKKLVLVPRPGVGPFQDRLDVLLRDDEVATDEGLALGDHLHQVGHLVLVKHDHLAVFQAKWVSSALGIGYHRLTS